MKPTTNGANPSGWRTWSAKEKRDFFAWLLLPSPIYPIEPAKVGDAGNASCSPSRIFSDALDGYEQTHREWWNTMLEKELPQNYDGLTDVVLGTGVKRGSPLWHCAKILEIISMTRTTLERNDIEKTATLALALGFYMSRLATMTGQYEIIKIGSKLVPKFKVGRVTANATRQADAALQHQRWISTAKDIWKRSPRLSVSACAEHVIAKLKLDARPKTVADAIRPHKIRRAARKKVGEAS